MDRRTNNMQALPVLCRIKPPAVKSTRERAFEDGRLSQQPKLTHTYNIHLFNKPRMHLFAILFYFLNIVINIVPWAC